MSQFTLSASVRRTGVLFSPASASSGTTAPPCPVRFIILYQRPAAAPRPQVDASRLAHRIVTSIQVDGCDRKIGFEVMQRSNMELAGPWPYRLFLALDGAAGVCAVLLVRRAARAESGL